MFNNNHAQNIKVVKFTLKNDAGYGTQFRREFRPNVTMDGLDQITEMLASHTPIEAATMAGISNELMAPSAQGTAVSVVNGWNERRFRFYMVVEVSSRMMRNYYVLSGFTDYMDYTCGAFGASVHLSPEMMCYVNSVYQTRNAPVGIFGQTTGYHDPGMFVRSQLLSNDVSMASNANTSLYSLRPSEIFAQSQSEMMIGETGDEVFDLRMLVNTPTAADMDYLHAPDYLAKTCKRYMSTVCDEDMGSIEAMGSCYNEINRSGNFNQNRFFTALRNERGENLSYTRGFSIKELLAIDPNATNDDICAVVTSDNMFVTAKKDLATGNNTASWGETDLIRQTGWQINLSISSLMAKFGLTELVVGASNEGIGCQMTVQIIRAWGMGGKLPESHEAVLAQKLSEEVFMPASMHGEYILSGVFDYSLMGKTYMSFCLGNHDTYEFIVPTYCDSLFSPMATDNPDSIKHMAMQFGEIFQRIHADVSSSAMNNDTTFVGMSDL